MLKNLIPAVLSCAVLFTYAGCKDSEKSEATSSTVVKGAKPAAKPAAAPKKAPAPKPAPAGPTCEQFSGHIVKLFEDIMGADAMLTKSDLPEIIKGCKREGTVSKHPAGVACIMKASTEADVDACKPSLMSMIKDW